VLEKILIQPFNTWNANTSVNVPLLVPTAYARVAEANESKQAAQQTALASEGDVLLQTARTYYQVVAQQGILSAALRAIDTAKESLRVADTRYKEGTETLLTVDRAKVDVNRAGQTLATAKQALGVARRSLETLTGEPVTQDFPSPEVPDMPALAEDAYVVQAKNTRPEVRSARATLDQQRASLAEAWLQLAPKVTGAATEFFTNATGFLRRTAYSTAGLNLAWPIDPVGTTGAIRRAEAVVEEQRQRLLQTEDTVRDDVHNVWLEIEADHARLEEATSESASAREALEQANRQFLAGTATSLDVSTAQRDAFNADATLAQAQADLAGALIALRKAAGEQLLSTKKTEAP
jgi:outer membrane protein